MAKNHPGMVVTDKSNCFLYNYVITAFDINLGFSLSCQFSLLFVGNQVVDEQRSGANMDNI